MSWKTFYRIAVILNLVVMVPLWTLWMLNGVITGAEQLFARFSISVIFGIGLIVVLFICVHTIAFGLAKIRGDNPRVDETASVIRIVMLGLFLVGSAGVCLYLLDWSVPAPVSAISGASLLLLIVFFVSGHWTDALKEIIEFKAFK